MKYFFSALFCIACMATGYAQKLTAEEYIALYKDLAIREMHRSGVPASITLAQGLLETESGNSDLVRRSNNHFGIKCKSNWTGESVKHTDDAVDECFRKYGSPEESYIDHSNFLRNNKRYANLFTLKPNDYKGWAYGLKKAGYATNPRYPNILISHIEKHNLQQYDNATQDVKQHTIALESEVKMTATETVEAGKVVPEAVDPNKKTLFNGIKAGFVKKGTSLLAVATQYKIDLSKLMAYNDLKTDGLIAEDQMIYLAKKHKEAHIPQYQTKSAETLYDIAQNHGVQLHALMEYNQLTESAIVPAGTIVKLQKNAVIAQQSIAKADMKQVRYHQVKSKEGLYSIARQHGVTVEDLKKWNQLSTDHLAIGQQLIISK